MEEAVPDLVIMDPPRSGSTPAFLDAVSSAGVKEIIYISCGPEALKRDVDHLKSKGYKLQRIRPVDLFPFTEHCEVVVSMFRGSKAEDRYSSPD